MKPGPPIPDRLKPADPSLGVPSQVEIDERAAALAKADGRTEPSEADFAQAARELAAVEGPPAPPEEAGPEVAQVTSWDEPLNQTGQRVQRTGPDDEATVGETLVLDGLEEADHDIRTEAADEPL